MGSSDWALEWASREFGDVPRKYICFKCIGDGALKKFIKTTAKHNSCSYCNRKSNSNIAITLELFLEHVQKSLRREYLLPEDACIPHDKYGWIIEPYHISDVLELEPITSEHGKIEQDVISLLSDNAYSIPAGNGFDQYQDMWGNFVNFVKYKTRFMFFREDFAIDKFDDPRGILDAAGQLMHQIIHPIPAGTQITRVRILNENNTQMRACDLGTNTPERTKFPNRMSPAGIPLFYGADTLTTAVKEVAQTANGAHCYAGIFETSRSSLMIDFTKPIKVPSIYDQKNSHKRASKRFLESFSSEMALPVNKDGEENIDYIPTQIVSEFIRHILKHNKKKIDGIIYKSSQHYGGICYALFVDHLHCVESPPSAISNDLYLLLKKIESHPLTNVQH